MVIEMIKIYNDKHKKFWGLMGPIFGSKEIRKELPYIYHEKDKVWFLKIINDNIIGFCSALEKEKEIVIGNGFVFPDNRGMGYFKELFEFRLEYILNNFEKKPIKSILKKSLYNVYNVNGFKIIKSSTNYHWMVMENEQEN